ncbi:uncharacterized protein LOC133898549 [Phragmites australis]|uniref:uncharacterized protein LOC133898549 n=1 Tax=Phragmites australis TaxID=29695 RepID=UPI002D7A1C54|nr:uncharacterized protein LOC133898549 [Phragmites australis]
MSSSSHATVAFPHLDRHAFSNAGEEQDQPEPGPPDAAAGVDCHAEPVRRLGATPPSQQQQLPLLHPSAPAAACAAYAGNGKPAAKKRGVQKLLKSAFKRGEHATGASNSSAEEDASAAAAAQNLSRSSSSSAGGSSGRKGRRAGGGDDGSADGDRSSHDSLDLEC